MKSKIRKILSASFFSVLISSEYILLLKQEKGWLRHRSVKSELFYKFNILQIW